MLVQAQSGLSVRRLRSKVRPHNKFGISKGNDDAA
jgi:hypothetical protein